MNLLAFTLIITPQVRRSSFWNHALGVMIRTALVDCARARHDAETQVRKATGKDFGPLPGHEISMHAFHQMVLGRALEPGGWRCRPTEILVYPLCPSRDSLFSGKRRC